MQLLTGLEDRSAQQGALVPADTCSHGRYIPFSAAVLQFSHAREEPIVSFTVDLLVHRHLAAGRAVFHGGASADSMVLIMALQ